ncbi:hypothetical protein ES708_20789 [subsurface metagenome]
MCLLLHPGLDVGDGITQDGIEGLTHKIRRLGWNLVHDYFVGQRRYIETLHVLGDKIGIEDALIQSQRQAED